MIITKSSAPKGVNDVILVGLNDNDIKELKTGSPFLSKVPECKAEILLTYKDSGVRTGNLKPEILELELSDAYVAHMQSAKGKTIKVTTESYDVVFIYGPTDTAIYGHLKKLGIGGMPEIGGDNYGGFLT